MTATGVLEVTATKKAKKTTLRSCFYEGALKITRPVYLDPHSPTIYLIHVGGGYVNGDEYLTSIQLEDGAEMSVTTQSSTKVYRTPSAPVLQKTDIRLGKESVLEYIPDPLIAYQDAKFIQQTTVHLEEDSTLIYSDIITPGWAKDGRLFQYDWIRSKLEVYKEERMIVYDHLLLEPDEEFDGLMQMDGFTHIGMFLVIDQRVDKKWINTLYEMLSTEEADVSFGLSKLPDNGCIIRVLGYQSYVIEKLIAKAHDWIRERLLDKEVIRWRKY
jgi:urease accessory protein